MEYKITLEANDGELLRQIINGAICMTKTSGLPIDPNSHSSIEKLKELARLIVCCSVNNNQGESIECTMI